MNVERKKIPPISFAEPTVSVNYEQLKLVDQKPFTPKLKVNPMFLIRKKVFSWAISLLATIPEAYIWDFIQQIVEKLSTRFKKKAPYWLVLVLRVLERIVAAVDPRSPGGRKITKQEVISIVNEVYG